MYYYILDGRTVVARSETKPKDEPFIASDKFIPIYLAEVVDGQIIRGAE